MIASPGAQREVVGILEVILIGIALSADAMSVTICNLVANPKLSHARAFLMPLLFGLFQGLMPVLGYYAGSLAGDFVERYSGIIALLILGFVGGKMLWDGIHDDNGEDELEAARDHVSLASMLAQAVATSIDAFAVGITLAATREPVFVDAGIIALCTFVLCLAMVVVGRKLGEHFGARAQIAGGIVLILIGIKACFF